MLPPWLHGYWIGYSGNVSSKRCFDRGILMMLLNSSFLFRRGTLLYSLVSFKYFCPTLSLWILLMLSNQLYQALLIKLRNYIIQEKTIMLPKKPNSKKEDSNVRQFDESAIKNIYSMMDKQEATILHLLNKYSDVGNQSDQRQEVSRNSKLYLKSGNIVSKSILTSKDIQKDRSKSRIKSLFKSQHLNQEIVTLPFVSQRNKLSNSRNKQGSRRKAHSTLESHRSRLDSSPHSKISGELYRIYGWHKQKKNQEVVKIQKNKQKVPKKLQPIDNSIILKQKGVRSLDFEQEQLDQKQIQSDDSSDHEYASAEQYERQFKKTMSKQLKQETNFLFFSRNTSTKDWSQNLLALIESHDKQLKALKKRSSYLRTFDQSFFSLGILNTF